MFNIHALSKKKTLNLQVIEKLNKLCTIRPTWVWMAEEKKIVFVFIMYSKRGRHLIHVCEWERDFRSSQAFLAALFL